MRRRYGLFIFFLTGAIFGWFFRGIFLPTSESNPNPIAENRNLAENSTQSKNSPTDQPPLGDPSKNPQFIAGGIDISLSNLFQMQKLVDEKKFEELINFRKSATFGKYDSEAEKLLKSGLWQYSILLVDRKEYSKAIIHLEKLTDYTANNIPVLSLLATAYENNGNYGQAVLTLNKIYDLSSDESLRSEIQNKIHAVRKQQAQILADSKDLQKLREFYEAIVYKENANPYNPQYYILLGKLQLNAGYPDNARASFTQAFYSENTRAEAAALLQQLDKSQRPAETQTISPDPNSIRIPLMKIDNHFLVRVRLNNSVDATLIIDTGASLLNISQSLANKLEISVNSQTQQIWFNTANGRAKFPIVDIASVDLNGARAENIKAAISNSFPQNSQIDGLLGMNFFRYYDFSFLQDENVLILKKK
jgi:clan AA aspartic protease (TIGR02281 family)